jgi:hypothetical protein
MATPPTVARLVVRKKANQIALVRGEVLENAMIQNWIRHELEMMCE